MSSEKQTLEAAVVEACGWLYQKGLIASSEGNVSVRFGANRLLVTPRGVHKGFLDTTQLTVTDLDGKQLSGDLPPSSELLLHLIVYRQRPDVNAVIHAHPTHAIACSLAGISLAEGVLPEIITSLGAVPTVPYTTPGTARTAEVIRNLILQFDAIILARHGSVTAGIDLADAFSKLELLEHAAQILSLANRLGSVSPLPREEWEYLVEAGGRSPEQIMASAPGMAVEENLNRDRRQK